MFFRFMRGVVRVVLFLINGNARYQNKEVLPKNENYILVAPHRTWWDPLYLAVAARPKKFSFMAKEELFKNPILRFILIHANAFPVKRDKPGPSAVKTPVKILKETDLSLIMFPSGTRHATALKGGMALIAKMAKVKIVPSKRWTKRAWRKSNGASRVHLTHWIKRLIRHLFIKSMSPKEKINT